MQRRALPGFAFALLVLAACSSSSTPGPASTKDGGADGTVAVPCGGCPSGSSCFFPIGSCAAAGECMTDLVAGSGCSSFEALCGCNGGPTVRAGCGFPSGYASGPTSGGESCEPPPVPDAGDAAKEATPVEAGIPLATCATPESVASPCANECPFDETCVVPAGPDIGCAPDAASQCMPPPGSCRPSPATCRSGSACTCFVNAFCNTGISGADGGAFGNVGVVESGAYVVNCLNEP